jgi:hypothetical protein
MEKHGQLKRPPMRAFPLRLTWPAQHENEALDCLTLIYCTGASDEFGVLSLCPLRDLPAKDMASTACLPFDPAACNAI